jgi:hypothetical protein
MIPEPMRAVLVRATSHRMRTTIERRIGRVLRAWWSFCGRPGYWYDLTEEEYAKCLALPGIWQRKVPGIARSRVPRTTLGQCSNWT